MKKKIQLILLLLFFVFPACSSLFYSWKGFEMKDQIIYKTDNWIDFFPAEIKCKWQFRYPDKWKVERMNIYTAENTRIASFKPGIILLQEGQKVSDVIEFNRNFVRDDAPPDIDLKEQYIKIGKYHAYKFFTISERGMDNKSAQLISPYNYYLIIREDLILTATLFPPDGNDQQAVKEFEKLLASVEIEFTDT